MPTYKKYKEKLMLLVIKRTQAADRLRELVKREQIGQNQLTKAEMSVDYWTRRIRNITEPPIVTKYYDYDTRV